MEQKTTSRRGAGGRPSGSKKTETSDLVAKTRAASGTPPLTQEQFGREVGCGSSTIRRYELQSLLPTEGPVRAAILRLAKKYGVTP